MKNIMKEAHKMTKEIKREYPEVDYKAQLGICLSFLSKNEGDVEMIKYETEKGTKVEIGLNGKQVTDLIVNGVVVLKDATNNRNDVYLTDGYIVINNEHLCKKLGANVRRIKIESNKEINDIYNTKIEDAYDKANFKSGKKYFSFNQFVTEEKYDWK